MNSYPEHWPQFYTATIYKWQHLLADDKHKKIIVDSLKFLVTEKRIELISPAVFQQKLNYIYYNPLKAGLCINPEDCYYSSARFYFDGTDNFGMIAHYSGN